MPAMQETQEVWVQCLGGEDPLEKEMATHSSILIWEIPWTEEPGEPQSTGSKESDMTEHQQHTHTHTHTHTHIHTMLKEDCHMYYTVHFASVQIIILQ